MAKNPQKFLENYITKNVKGKFGNNDLKRLLTAASNKGITLEQQQINRALNTTGKKVGKKLNWGQLSSSQPTTTTQTPASPLTLTAIPDSIAQLPQGQRNAVLSMNSVRTPDPTSSSPTVGPVQQTPKQFINDYLKGVKDGDKTFNIKNKNDLKNSMEERNFDWDENLVEKQLGKDRFKGITVSQKLNNKWNPPENISEAVGMQTPQGDGKGPLAPGVSSISPPEDFEERSALLNASPD